MSAEVWWSEEVWWVDLINPRRVISKDRVIARADNQKDSPLIAAAPEMLDALELGADWLASFQDYFVDDEDNDLLAAGLKKMRAAIAKAKGE